MDTVIRQIRVHFKVSVSEQQRQVLMGSCNLVVSPSERETLKGRGVHVRMAPLQVCRGAVAMLPLGREGWAEGSAL